MTLDELEAIRKKHQPHNAAAAEQGEWTECEGCGRDYPCDAIKLLDHIDTLLDPRHIVEFSTTGYGLQHPVTCRPNLLDCSYEKWLAARQPRQKPGRYVMVHFTATYGFQKVK
jgi:hypothetical protein